jgi:hypothetical protein
MPPPPTTTRLASGTTQQEEGEEEEEEEEEEKEEEASERPLSECKQGNEGEKEEEDSHVKRNERNCSSSFRDKLQSFQVGFRQPVAAAEAKEEEIWQKSKAFLTTTCTPTCLH